MMLLGSSTHSRGLRARVHSSHNVESVHFDRVFSCEMICSCC